LSTTGSYTGTKSNRLHGGPIPLADAGHLADVNSTVTGTDTQKIAMSPAITGGQRKLLTVLDWAILDDLGWSLARPGDANADSSVNFDDLLVLARNYNATGKTWSEGDFNYDRRVNFDDLLALARSYNTGGALAPTSVEAGSESFAADWALAQSLVPEPSIALLGVSAAVGLAGRRRPR
jgi:hypothetical protein